MIVRIYPKDYPRLRQIWQSAVLATHDFLKDEDFEFLQNNLSSYFENIDLYGYYDPEGQILGFMGVVSDSLEMIFVDNPCRRMGIGRALIRYAMGKLAVQNVQVNQQNTTAVKFYLHFGFKAASTQAFDRHGKPYPIINMTYSK